MKKKANQYFWLPILFDGGPLVGGVNNFNLPKKINSNKAEIANSLALKFYSYRIHNWISIIDYAGKSPNVDSTHGTVPNCENSKKKHHPGPRPYTETLDIVFQMFPSKLTK